MHWMQLTGPVGSVVLGALVIGASACGPRVVTDVALTPTTAKVTYVKRSFLFPETGIVQCQRADDGSRTNCRKMELIFRKPGQ